MALPSTEPLFRFDVVACDELDRYPEGIDRIWQRAIDGLIVKNVFTESTIAAVLERHRRGTPELRRRTFDDVGDGSELPYVISRGLITSPPDLGDYFADAAHFRAGCRELFAGHQDFETRFTEILSRIGAGVPNAVPTGPEGQTYSPATIRVLPSGRQIGLHSGNDFLRRPECAHMRSLVDNVTQLSFFVPLELPTEGGELELYPVSWGDTDGERRVDGIPVALLVALGRRMVAPVRVGDLLVFDGGRIYHAVTPVGPGGRRVTIGGFLGYTTDHRSLYYWS